MTADPHTLHRSFYHRASGITTLSHPLIFRSGRLQPGEDLALKMPSTRDEFGRILDLWWPLARDQCASQPIQAAEGRDQRQAQPVQELPDRLCPHRQLRTAHTDVKLVMFLAIDRVSKFTYVEFHDSAG